MIKNNLGQLIYNEDDLVDMVMSGLDIIAPDHILVDSNITINKTQVDHLPNIICCEDSCTSAEEFDAKNQSNWFMPKEYTQMDIAEHVLNLCVTQDEIQRVGKELLLYQEKNLFDLLKYLKYLVDTMKQNNIIWGVGRGSSVASYVLYLLGVHRIDSMYYDLDPEEFLR